MFHAQLRAILRASYNSNVKLLIPMLSSISELKQTLHLIERAKQSLRDEKVLFNEHIQVGGMIEVPAAALGAEAFARHLDFLSIGTNDLTQYTLAIDRTDDTVAHLYNPLHPAVLQLVEMSIRAAIKCGKPISVCGEMAGDTRLTRLLLGFGLRQFSMHPANVLAVKRQILNSNLPKLAAGVRRILASSEVEKTELLLARLNA
jgi:phosphotransferase system enzyme I (PtsI)